jgi:hypothetical protein
LVAIDLLDKAVLRLTLAPSQHHSPVGQEHGRTIPLPVIIAIKANHLTPRSIPEAEADEPEFGVA